MLAWHCVMKTPQYPEGREVIMIANDVTVQSGSFGVQEDDFFFKASVYARERGIPRVFISCNSGARIGLVDELKPKFKVKNFFFFYLLVGIVDSSLLNLHAIYSILSLRPFLPPSFPPSLPTSLPTSLQVAWKEESNPSLGFDYLYLSEEDYSALPKGTVDAVRGIISCLIFVILPVYTCIFIHT